MRHGASVLVAGAALGAAALVFQLKGTVRELERELARTERTIEEARWRLQTLKADHAFLARPERLALQAAQLGMVPATASRLVAVQAIAHGQPQQEPAAKVVAVVLPSGERVELRFKPGPAARASATGGASAGLIRARAVP